MWLSYLSKSSVHWLETLNCKHSCHTLSLHFECTVRKSGLRCFNQSDISLRPSSSTVHWKTTTMRSKQLKVEQRKKSSVTRYYFGSCAWNIKLSWPRYRGDENVFRAKIFMSTGIVWVSNIKINKDLGESKHEHGFWPMIIELSTSRTEEAMTDFWDFFYRVYL